MRRGISSARRTGRYLAGLAGLAIYAAGSLIRPDTARAEPPELVQQEVLYDRDGARVERLQFRRSDELLGITMHLFRFEAGRFATAIVDQRHKPDAIVEARAPAKGWRFLVNASYFLPSWEPTYLLSSGGTVYHRFREGGSAVLSCLDGHCRIDHASEFDPDRWTDMSVQSSPRLIGHGRATQGVRGADKVDRRTGTAVTAGGDVLFFVIGGSPWSGMSFEEIRRYFQARGDIVDLLMLDGGSSSQYRFDAPDVSIATRGARNVPFLIELTGEGTRPLPRPPAKPHSPARPRSPASQGAAPARADSPGGSTAKAGG